ncbi:2'-5' RNA ligase family protein [Mycobacterium sp. CBMA293]|uniref:2'-5' RNA ligase family protein n=1 Tax=unclassified Mycolicibacterium TaxID=2636767 RepID=UPI0012DF4F94|nr:MULTISPECIES: 2'-5' RNA ligase family protein [unclassified Mycolicibacterium]MUL45284.1 2'-5' RNA ligase family protein [Mycolicibacterium sp. CBMA 360]MUL56804.1 2'-5' RNA ligase family protein [Mycolicibacterium sp. CBMA 335]MUL69843.1 2'-5' RNA ligase family protein [Mycolicibacterium sp. CBMA 311]MUL91891.1 2'-5' RNA ligase family protein [Mycolicibacterium sp. CBMA 230]MUM05630.1 hypothetical protein [Mycolicibacterium sp. CBMA 213]
MVHSVELLFDLDTEAAIRRAWDGLRAAGVSAQSPAARPHVTLVVASGMDHAVAEALSVLLPRFPLRCRVGSALVFGRSAAVLARMIVPSAELLDVHAEACRLAADHLTSEPMPHTQPGDWTPHVTLGRRVSAERLAAALAVAGRPAEIVGSFVGLRHWDGDNHTEYLI